MQSEPERIQAWDVWLDECAPVVRLGDDFGREELAERLAAAIEVPVIGQSMTYSARERWWRAWLRVEGEPELDLEVGADRTRLAALLARAVPQVPVKDHIGRWIVFGDRHRSH